MTEPAQECSFCASVTALVGSGLTARGPSSLLTPKVFAEALLLIERAEKIAIISGFFIPSCNAPETDGPPGALVLARSLSRCGKQAVIWTDSLCLSAFVAAAEPLSFPLRFIRDISNAKYGVKGADLLIYLERLGRASNGAYYNMRGEDVSAWTPALDSLALNASVPVIGIGDGGNEVGMGSYLQELSKMMPDYAACLSVVASDVAIPVDVSNWGGYALSALLSQKFGTWLGQTETEERRVLEALADSGAVDGVSRKKGLSVDGLPMERHLQLLESLTRKGGF